jgi:hypothetical protein
VHLQHIGEPAQRSIDAVLQHNEDDVNAVVGRRPKGRDPVIGGAVADDHDRSARRLGPLQAEGRRQCEAEATATGMRADSCTSGP